MRSCFLLSWLLHCLILLRTEAAIPTNLYWNSTNPLFNQVLLSDNLNCSNPQPLFGDRSPTSCSFSLQFKFNTIQEEVVLGVNENNHPWQYDQVTIITIWVKTMMNILFLVNLIQINLIHDGVIEILIQVNLICPSGPNSTEEHIVYSVTRWPPKLWIGLIFSFISGKQSFLDAIAYPLSVSQSVSGS